MNAPAPAPGEPFFSVVIPAFNAARFLRETLACVQKQTFGNFECIVVDDGSTDATPEIVASFERDPRFRSIRISHGGTPGRARNQGIRSASGEYVAFLDADDLWTTDKLERYFDHIRGTGATLVFSNWYAIDDSGRRISQVLSRRMKRQLPVGDPFLVVSNIVALGSVAVKRAVVGEILFSEDPDLRAVEDYHLWLQLNAQHPFDYISDPLLLYRCHSEQIHRDYAEQVRKREKILGDPMIARSYGDGTVELARALIELRKRYTQQGLFAALRSALGLTRWLRTPQRDTFLYYLRFGLLQRAKTLTRQKLMGLPVGV